MKKSIDIIKRSAVRPPEPVYEPIQTYAFGHHFRSRLEARWSTFFSSLNVPWHYEMEGFELGVGVRYLPDFWLPQQDCWVEIKGAMPTAEEERKAALLATATGKRVLIFYGPIPYVIGNDGPHDTASAFLFAPGECSDNCYAWCECPACSALGIEYQARADRLPCRRCGSCQTSRNRDRGHNGDTPRLLRAYQAARHCRFDNSDRPLIGKN